MKQLRIICTALAIVVLVAVLCWHPVIATPNTGLTPEARAELMQTLGK